jgi:hypothetical protein
MGIGIVATGKGGATSGMFMPGIASGFGGSAVLAGAFFSFAGAAFFFPTGLTGAGMLMPGMFICACAGAPAAAKANADPSRNPDRFTLAPWKEAPPTGCRGCDFGPGSAVAVLAGAGVAAAAALGASAIPLRFDVLAILHFNSPFSLLTSERITI